EEPASSEIAFYSDRFIFRSQNLDDLVIAVFAFERGRQEEGYYGEFMGAIFERNRWAFFEGNDKYAYVSSDLKKIFPSYYAKVDGTSVSGFQLVYDGGDYTVKVSSGTEQAVTHPQNSEILDKKVGVAEAVLTVHGTEHWGDLIHESLYWKGFNALRRYNGLFKNYQGFYLKSEKGDQIYFYKNSADQRAFLKRYPLSESLLPETGVIFHENKEVDHFNTPIVLKTIERMTPPFALYKIPERWEVIVNPDYGSLFLWSRKKISINWLMGGYVMMAIEGVIKNGEAEERLWGFAEYFP
ncbi:MAG: hypothetical protein ACE5F7_08745, partial [Nitrospiria bacterium]